MILPILGTQRVQGWRVLAGCIKQGPTWLGQVLIATTSEENHRPHTKVKDKTTYAGVDMAGDRSCLPRHSSSCKKNWGPMRGTENRCHQCWTSSHELPEAGLLRESVLASSHFIVTQRTRTNKGGAASSHPPSFFACAGLVLLYRTCAARHTQHHHPSSNGATTKPNKSCFFSKAAENPTFVDVVTRQELSACGSGD